MTHREHKSVVIVGGGQAGLSVSYYLCREGLDHVILERHQKFHSWRSNRWDTFCLVTPNWQCRLPDFPYQGTDPEGFMVKDEITDYLDAFAETFDPPVIENCEVTKITQRPGGGYFVDSSQGDFSADQVVIATGGYDNPIVPPYAKTLDPSIQQMHSVDYRRPAQMPEGGTLVVGTGQSGVQLMEDLHLEGRDVHLAVGPAPRSPRMYRGRDATDWLYEMGHYHMTIDKHPNPEHAVSKTNHYMTGRDGGHEIDLRKFAREGVSLYGSVSGMDGSRIQFLPDLEANLDDADQSYVRIREAVDSYIDKNNIDAPTEPAFEKVWRPEQEITEIDCKKEGITSILWAIGFRPDYHWIDVDVFDARGRPVYRRGVCKTEGFYFIGLGWLNTWGSGRFLGIDEDSRYLVQQIAAKAKSTLQVAS
ncbi:putative oxidoreductase CzcO [Tritonibacter multivorans]|uniref:Putative oxidoreductase CzcO n=1 Tax=Tritonibacter multivorans TaxID=928856 RepID=A0A0N7LZV1_9RHOB|nr:MSMEG_0569 family flavin-dependent oxidoreductase [Tritonibacter multivorans]MDA7422000.1 MSMEG_0569 family flavin-dependent oxidoreductase [Tritonibacter multivorans]CUH78689.1 putative oxidoreductase CzcO [Tritonibacter multivorans]SFD66032.1 putative flavoprotein involved in K+ transport [Tritonibacter multivorans]